MATIKPDVLVIGAGSGGLSVAAGAAQMGAHVVLLEGHKMGGDCLNYGCVPSKALLAASKVQMGYSAAKDYVQKAVATIAPHDSVERFEKLGVRVIKEFGSFISPTEVKAGDNIIRARRVVIATGSGPLIPKIPGLTDVPFYTNENIFDLREKPKHLLIIGGGPIGMEMAQAHRRLGCEVTVIEGQRALGKDDPEMSSIVLQSLRNDGITIVENTLAERILGKAGNIEVKTSHDSVKGSHLLVAVGRKVNIEKLNLTAGGIDVRSCAIKVDEQLKTTNKRVYAIGDVVGGLQFTHVAGYHAGVIIRSMLFAFPAKAKTAHLPWATYTDPELAQVGLTQAQALSRYGEKLSIVRFDFAGSDRAITDSKIMGLIKVMVVKGRPVGASIAGAGAGDLIGLWSMAMANNLKMSAIASTVLPYPSMGEVNKRVVSTYFSPMLFDNIMVKRFVRLVQRFLP